MRWAWWCKLVGGANARLSLKDIQISIKQFNKEMNKLSILSKKKKYSTKWIWVCEGSVFLVGVAYRSLYNKKEGYTEKITEKKAKKNKC